MSPGKLGATVTWPGPPVEVKVLTKNDSPPRTLRIADFSRPPCMPLSTCTFEVIETIAPVSAFSVSPAARSMIPRAYAGRCSTLIRIASPCRGSSG